MEIRRVDVSAIDGIPHLSPYQVEVGGGATSLEVCRLTACWFQTKYKTYYKTSIADW
jgi:hypothetical protein